MTTDTQKNHSDRTIIIAGFHGAIFVYLFLLLPFVAAQSGTPPPIDDPYGFNAKFSPSTAVIIVVLITAFLFMGFFSIYIRQCAEDPNGGSIRPGILGGGRSRRGPRGLDPAVIETFPTFAYSVVKGLKIGKGTLECAVCLNEFEDDETLRLLPKCDHVFHPECIDLWLATHTTCPVCRANLAVEAGEVAVNSTESAPIPDSGGGLDQSPDIGNTQNQVSVRVIDDQNREMPAPDVINPNHIPIQNRPARSGSRSTRPRFTGKFPRSHSTGHSLVQPGENCERFTLRLPEDVRKQIVNGKLNRTTSCLAFPTEGSSRRGYRSGGEGSSRGKNYRFARVDSLAVKSDRWMFSMTPPFLSRTYSARSPKVAAEGDASTSSAKAFFTSVKTPFDCLGTKNDGAEQSSTRPPV